MYQQKQHCDLAGIEAELQAAHEQLSQLKQKSNANTELAQQDKAKSAAALRQAKEDLTQVMLYVLGHSTNGRLMLSHAVTAWSCNNMGPDSGNAVTA